MTKLMLRNRQPEEKPTLKKRTPEQQTKRQQLLAASKATQDKPFYIPIDASIVVSTGSTLLDLAISGGRIRGGGVPGGIMMEIFGPSGCGKTALMVEIGASVQDKGGTVDIIDPESRLDKQYARTYGLELPKDHYYRMNTVTEVFDFIDDWDPDNLKVINMIGSDSVSALSTEMEMTEGDKRGQRKAKELHSGCRTTARKIAEDNKLLVFTNQQLDGEYGATTSGGKAIGYYSSVRLQIKRKSRLTKKKKFKHEKKAVEVQKSVGILSEVTVIKSSVDDEYRTAPIYIMPGIGIDDIRANLQWMKEKTGNTKYACPDGKEYAYLDPAIKWIEDNNLEAKLREEVIDVWEQIEEAFKVERKKKVRF